MLDTHRRNHDKLVAQICANQLKIQTKKDVLSLSVRARSLPSFEGMDTENRLMGTFFCFLITDIQTIGFVLKFFISCPSSALAPDHGYFFRAAGEKSTLENLEVQ